MNNKSNIKISTIKRIKVTKTTKSSSSTQTSSSSPTGGKWRSVKTNRFVIRN